MWWQSSASLFFRLVVLVLVLIFVLGRGGKGVCGAVFFVEEEEDVDA